MCKVSICELSFGGFGKNKKDVLGYCEASRARATAACSFLR